MSDVVQYCPSNGTEGEWFLAKFCERCIHERFIHTQNHNDLKCDILDRSMMYLSSDPNYPKEWIYGEKENDFEPLCTNFKFWNHNDGPPEIPDPPDPNQLKLFDE